MARMGDVSSQPHNHVGLFFFRFLRSQSSIPQTKPLPSRGSQPHSEDNTTITAVSQTFAGRQAVQLVVKCADFGAGHQV